MTRIPRKMIIIFGAAALFFLGVGAGFMLHNQAPKNYRSLRETTSDYKFITPFLMLEVPEENSFPEYRPLKDALTSYINTAKNSGAVKEMSVYFRNLNTSQWIAIHPEERFSPSSMLKVAVAIAVLNEVEQNPALLQKKVAAEGVEQFTEKQEAYAPANPMISGKTYTVEELLKKLITESDNAANHALSRIVGDEQVMKVYDDLSLHRPTASDPGYTPAEYSRLFRTLYNSTYLSRAQSEYLLSLLSQTTFTQGLVAGVPENVTLSHKFGDRTSENDQIRELHDCGIVYYPNHPYFICVMTRGTEFPTLEKTIAKTSAIVWQQVSSVH